MFAIALTGAILAFGTVAQAEKRVFVIGNDASYGIDHCLTPGAACGPAVAAAFCRGHEFRHAVGYRKVDRNDITGTIPSYRGPCRRGACADFVAIECAR